MSQNENQSPLSQYYLSQLARRPQLTGIWYNQKDVTLDGFNFVQCRFDNCNLYVSSANFEVHRCFFDDRTKIYYEGDVVKVLRLFNSRNPWVYDNHPFFAPERHENDTISIVY